MKILYYNSVKLLFLFMLPVFLMSSCERLASVAPNAEAAKHGHKSTSSFREGGSPGPMEAMAAAIAKALTKPEVRYFIQQQAQIQFDGDYNILYSQIRNKQYVGYTIEQILKQNWDPNSTYDLTSFANDNPLLNISIPINFDTWDWKNYTPDVAVRDLNKTSTDTLINSYNSAGQLKLISSETEPTVPYVAVGLSESIRLENGRLIAYYYDNVTNLKAGCKDCIPYDQVVNSSFTNSAQPTNGLILNTGVDGNPDLPPGMVGGPLPNPLPLPPTCDRDKRKAKDEMGDVKFQSLTELKRVERWIDGKLELYCIIVLGDKNPNAFISLKKTARAKRGCFRTCHLFNCDNMEWCGLFSGTEVKTWDKQKYGDTMIYDFWEDDNGGSEQTSTISLSTTYTNPATPGTTVNSSVSITTKVGDTEIGSSAVEYCDAAEGDGYTYRAGGLNFKVHLKK